MNRWFYHHWEKKKKGLDFVQCSEPRWDQQYVLALRQDSSQK